MDAFAMRIVVTGTTGFIGSYLAEMLIDDGHEVIALARRPEVVSVRDGLTPMECDLMRDVELDIPGVDAIVHLAQANVDPRERPRELFGVNTVSTNELLAWGARAEVRRFVYASSGSIYGLGDGAVSEETPRRATDLYAVSKRSAEDLVGAYASEYDSTVVVRPFAPYGPGQQGRLVPGLIARIREGRPVTINDGGRPRMTPIFVDDVARAFAAALELEGDHVVNVAGDEVVSIAELAELIGDALGRAPSFAPGPGVHGDLIAVNSRMHELLRMGMLVPLAEGIPATTLAGVRA
jgi:UDP-glucose 4-epimerase